MIHEGWDAEEIPAATRKGLGNFVDQEELDLSLDAIMHRRELWCASLQSGNFGQYTNYLANADFTAFCCLGVAYESVPDLKGVRIGGTIRIERREGCYQDPEKQINRQRLSNRARRLLGLTEPDANVLTLLNDRGTSFSVIAEVIKCMEIHPNLT